MKSVGVDMNFVVNEELDDECPRFDPREKEQELMSKKRRMRIYQVGKRLYARTSECFTTNNDQNESNWSIMKLIIEKLIIFSRYIHSKRETL
jgi:asparagine synthetase A